jgi:cytoskeleton protein RodZ
MPTTIGERLTTAREERGLTLADAAERTYIRERYLRALEAEQFDALGEDVYVKGFLRSYAKALDLDPDPLLDVYRAQYEHPPPDEAALTGRVLQGAEGQLPRSVRVTAGAAAIVLVFALLAAVGQLNGSQPAETPTESAPPPSDDDVVDADPGDATGDAPEPSAAGEPGDAGTAGERAADPEPPRTDPAPDPQPGAGVEVEVAVAGGDSWVRVTVDGAVAFEGVKADGESVTYAGDEEVSLRIGNAGAVRLTVNGEEHGAAGGGGEVVERRYRADEQTSA